MKILRYISLGLLLICSPSLMAMQALQEKQQKVAAVQFKEAQAAQKLAEQEKEREQQRRQERERQRYQEQVASEKAQLAHDNAQLLTLNNGGAGVLPVVYKEGVKYVLLGRERRNDNYGRGKGTWDSFAGGKKGVETLWQTAAREGWEEMNAASILKMNEQQMMEHINATASNTEAVIVLRLRKPTEAKPELYYALYITRFTEHQIDKMLNNFGKPGYVQDDEKDKIALVAWDELRYVIVPTEYSKETEEASLTVKTREGEPIKLRPIVVKVLRPYLQRDASNQGLYNKIHTYIKW